MTPDQQGQATEPPREVVVAGSIVVDPSARDAYLEGSRIVVEQARQAPGCLDFALSADLIEPDRINVFEHWESVAAVEAFRGSGPSADQAATIRQATVLQHEITSSQTL